MNMKFDEYQSRSNATNVVDKNVQLQYLSTGLAGEVGELCSYIAKRYRKDKEMTPETLEEYRQSIKGELGDIMWFVSELASLHGFLLSEVANYNITKLHDRMIRGVIKGSGDNR